MVEKQQDRINGMPLELIDWINKNAKILLPSREPRTKANVPCDGNGTEKIGHHLPTDPFLGVHPLQRSSQDLTHYNPTTSVLWVCTPSILLFTGHNALRHTKSLLFSPFPLFSFSPTPLPCPDWADTLTVSGGFVDTLSVSGVWTPGGRMCDSSFNQSAFVACDWRRNL